MGFELNGFSTSLGGISWNKTTSSKEMFSHLLFFLESKRILVNPIELEFKDWCIESVLEIKQQLVNITQEVELKDFDADMIRNLVDACNTYLDTVTPMNLPGIIYKKDGKYYAVKTSKFITEEKIMMANGPAVQCTIWQKVWAARRV